MFDFDAGKLVIIGIVALVVIGPKELPRVLRYVGQTVGKMRRLAADFQAQFMEAMKEADVADIKADVAKLAESAKLDVNFNPIYDLKTQITDAVHGSQADAMPATADVPAIAAPESQSQADLPGSIGDAAEAGLAPVAEVKPAPDVEAPAAFAPPEPAPHAPVPHAAEPAPLRNSA